LIAVGIEDSFEVTFIRAHSWDDISENSHTQKRSCLARRIKAT